MDIEKTRRYYARLTDADVCDCAYCRNYVKEIRAAYPELDAYADQLGIDLEKPLETIPVEPAEGRILYSGAQYVVLGAADEFGETSVRNVRVFVADSHPMTGIAEEHFVIELSPIWLDWTGENADGAPQEREGTL